MANTKISGMTADTSPASTDVLWKQDSGGTADRKLALQNISAVPGLITSLTEDTAPDRVADYGITYDASASGNKKVLLKYYGAYTLHAEYGAAHSPADSTTYYWGSFYQAAPTTNTNVRRIYVPRAGKIIACYGWFFVSGTTGSSENVALSVRVNGTTDASIGNATMDAAAITFNNASMTQAVSAGDYIEIKMVTPAFATNPTNVYGFCTILIA